MFHNLTIPFYHLRQELENFLHVPPPFDMQVIIKLNQHITLLLQFDNYCCQNFCGET